MHVLGWNGVMQKSLLANKLDDKAHLLLKITVYRIYYMSKKNWQGALDAMEEVPTPSFHWWNTYMGMSFHFLGDKDRARSYYNVVKEAYGENTKKWLKLTLFKISFKCGIIEPLLHRYGCN